MSSLDEAVGALRVVHLKYRTKLEEWKEQVKGAHAEQQHFAEIAQARGNDMAALQVELTKANSDTASAYTEARDTASSLMKVLTELDRTREDAKFGLADRQKAHATMVEGITELEGALRRCQHDLSRLDEQSRASAQHIHRVTQRLQRNFTSLGADHSRKAKTSKEDAPTNLGDVSWQAQAELLNTQVTVACTWATSSRSQLVAAQDKIRQLTAELTEEKTQRLLVVEDLANQKGLMHDAVTMERQQGELQRRELHATVAGELDATHGRLRDAEAQLQHVVRQQRVASLGKYLI